MNSLPSLVSFKTENSVMLPAPPMMFGRSAYEIEVVQLREKIETLEETVARLRDLLAPAAMAFPEGWELTPKEADLLRVLMTTVSITKENILVALYEHDPEVDIKIVDVFVCKLRKKLAKQKRKIRIDTVWGHGYKLTPDMKALISEECRFERETALSIGRGEMPNVRPVMVIAPVKTPAQVGAEVRALRADLEIDEPTAARMAGLKQGSFVFLVENGKGTHVQGTALVRALQAERNRRDSTADYLTA